MRSSEPRGAFPLLPEVGSLIAVFPKGVPVPYIERTPELGKWGGLANVCPWRGGSGWAVSAIQMKDPGQTMAGP